jgi:hypothetical protein
MKTLKLFLTLTIGLVLSASIGNVAASVADLPALSYLIPSASIALGALSFNTGSLAFTTIAPMSVQDIERYANENLSHFDGTMVPFEGGNSYFEGYTGAHDDFVDFGGKPGSFANEFETELQFTINITKDNTAGTIYIIPGQLWMRASTSNGFLTNSGGKDTAGTAITSASGSPSDITDFYDFIYNNPTNLLGLKVTSSTATQFNNPLVIEEQSPFRGLQTRNINLASISDQNTFQTSIGKIATPGVIIGNQTRMRILIPASATTSVIFYCGGMINQSRALEKKVDKAKFTMAHVGVENVRAIQDRFPAAMPNVKVLSAGR